MTKETLVFLLGIVVLVTPYLGVPDQWKVYIATGCGVLLVVFGYALRHKAYIRSIEKENGELDTDSFVESNNPQHKEDTNV